MAQDPLRGGGAVRRSPLREDGSSPQDPVREDRAARRGPGGRGLGWVRRGAVTDDDEVGGGYSWHGRGDPESEEGDEPEDLWNPQLRRTAGRGLERDDGDPQVPWESLPPSARHYGVPADPGLSGRVRWRRPAGVVLVLLLATGLIAALVMVVLRVAVPAPATVRLSDSRAGVTITLPAGWQEAGVPPVTGFTSAARSDGALVMARPVPDPVADLRKAAKDAAELYSRLLLKGDKVDIVEDKVLPQGHTRALRAQYQDVANTPAYLRVTLLTRDGKAVLLVGLLQPEETTRRQALDAVMSSVR